MAENGYRIDEAPARVRPQQNLFYRELGLELKQIEAILATPGFDTLSALRSHREKLRRNMGRLRTLLETVDCTLGHLEGTHPMSDSGFFTRFDDLKQAEHEKQVVERWGADNPAYLQSKERWSAYDRVRHEEILAEGQSIAQALASLTDRLPSELEAQS